MSLDDDRNFIKLISEMSDTLVLGPSGQFSKTLPIPGCQYPPICCKYAQGKNVLKITKIMFSLINGQKFTITIFTGSSLEMNFQKHFRLSS